MHATRLPRPTRAFSHLRPSLSFSPLAATRPSQRPRTTRQALPPHIRHTSTFQPGPSPPRLPADQQAEFERLQRTANTQEGFNATSSPDFASPSSSSSSATNAREKDMDTAQPAPLRKGAPPEFDGDVNPRTGEVGGPKNEPLRWGAAGDYSFNGRVTDF
ncbi:hypothetical protein F4824DRAFT_375561 [Ustulina deusta]|nr:hypothetical protein F4823DRAFT_336385 [Ustulina deusta]KAI3329719.1 hypothetical protein F4824DRAFT_375561 [Ustulina deusta]